MELLKGETLAQRIQRVKRLSVSEAIEIACEIASALAAVHAKGYHSPRRQPSNVFLVPLERGGHQVKIVDFGIARPIAGLRDAPKLHAMLSQGGQPIPTERGIVFGSAAYMSPEQAMGEELDSAQRRLRARGGRLRTATGSLPFDDDDMLRLAARHVTDTPEPITSRAPDADIPTSLEQVVDRALAKAPGERFATAQQLAAALRQLVDSDSLAAFAVNRARSPLPDDDVLPPRRARSRAPLMLALLALAATGFFVAASVLTRGLPASRARRVCSPRRRRFLAAAPGPVTELPIPRSCPSPSRARHLRPARRPEPSRSPPPHAEARRARRARGTASGLRARSSKTPAW